MAYSFQEIIRTHQDYDDHHNQWSYFIRSYLGGIEYKNGSYLHRYATELDLEYAKRVFNTALDNHCRNVVQIYSSFLFRVPATRELGSLKEEPSIDNFIKDCDLDGNSFESQIKQAQIYSSIYGSCWLILDKPSTNLNTRADELQQDIRPYLTLVTPENVLDWNFKRELNGKYSLDFLKVREEVDKRGGVYYRIWTPETIECYYQRNNRTDPILKESFPNQIGRIPAIILYNQKSHKRGIGLSDLTDIADLQKGIYNEYSEIEQLIRLSNNPSLVKTPDVNASAGAGAIINMPDGLDPNLKPYLLQPSGQNLTSIMECINKKVEAIDRISHIGSVRATAQGTQSGIALQTEFQLLNAKLSEKADNLQIAEENLFRIYALFQNKAFDGEITYPDTFNLRDYATDLQYYLQAKNSGVQSPAFIKEIDKEIARGVVEDSNALDAIIEEIDNTSGTGEFTQKEVNQEEVENEPVG